MRCNFPAAAARSRGFAAILAIFMVVTLAALGATIATVSMATNRTQALDFLSVQAYQAVNAGLDYGVYQAMTASSCPASSTLEPTQWSNRFWINLQCSLVTTDDWCQQPLEDDPSVIVETACTTKVYNIIATACAKRPDVGSDSSTDPCPGNAAAGYIERQMRITIEGVGS